MLKWVGSKRKYCNFIYDIIKKQKIEFNNVYEPFFGSGALTFYLISKGHVNSKYFCNDFNEQLINFYKRIKDNYLKVFNEICKIVKTFDKNFYYSLRDKYNKTINKLTYENAAIFYVINKTCFNGIYRVNSHGSFNVPHGKESWDIKLDKNKFSNFAKKLSYCELTHTDWLNSVKNAKKGDLVYLDPPYFIDSSSKFIGYTDPQFNEEEYLKMIKEIVKLTKRGAFVLLSNSNSEELKKLLLKNNLQFKLEKYLPSRTINPKLSKSRRDEFTETIYFFKGLSNE